MLNLFAVVHDQSRSDATNDRIAHRYGDDQFVVSPTVLLIRSSASDPDILRTDIGIGEGPGESVGVVFKLNASHAGYFNTQLWEWLKDTRQRV